MEVILHVKNLDIHTQLCVQGKQRTDVQKQGVRDETVKAEVTPMMSAKSQSVCSGGEGRELSPILW